MPIVPDTKNWTWVLEKPCAECRYDAGAVGFRDVPDLVRRNVASWARPLARPDARERPDDRTWSPLEYGAHVRDVFRVFEERLELMLREDDPRFANWDQDATARDDDYQAQDPTVVAGQLAAAGESVASSFDRVPDKASGRRGLRSDGSAFTVETLALYFLHDPIHHLHDVGGSAG